MGRCSNLDDVPENYAEWRKSVPKGYTLYGDIVYDSFYIYIDKYRDKYTYRYVDEALCIYTWFLK